MRVSVGFHTKRILLERDIYSKLVNEMSKIENRDISANKENLETVLRRYDPSLLNEYQIYYKRHNGRRIDLSFSLKKRNK